LREIAAASDFDFVALEPRRSDKGAARKRAKGQKKPAGADQSWLGAVWRYRTPALAIVLLASLLAAVVVNAMFLQHGRHPAPLFGSTLKIEPPRPPVRPASIDALLNERIPGLPLQPVDPAQEAAFAAPDVNDQTAAAPSSAAPSSRAAPSPAPMPAKKTHDAIGALIADNGVVTPAATGRSVVAAQRALQKLGAPVKPDGEFGAATRKAVESFQHENHLPVTGELNAKTRRLLAARSGLPVE
jgi:hypothetical protein